MQQQGGGAYPIHAAIASTKHRDDPSAAVETVKFLLDREPNVKLQTYKGRSLLLFACVGGYNDSNVIDDSNIEATLYSRHAKDHL